MQAEREAWRDEGWRDGGWRKEGWRKEGWKDVGMKEGGMEGWRDAVKKVRENAKASLERRVGTGGWGRIWGCKFPLRIRVKRQPAAGLAAEGCSAGELFWFGFAAAGPQ